MMMGKQPKKKGVENKGVDYEFCVAAHLALKLLQNEGIDFTFKLNPNIRGKLDDLFLEITHPSQDVDRFLVQIKHKEKGQLQVVAINPEVKSDRRYVNILDYENSYNSLDVHIRNTTTFLFYTNAKLNTQRLEHYQMVKSDDQDKFLQIFDSKDIWQAKATTNEQSTFLQRFYLLSNQKNLNEMITDIEIIFERWFKSKKYASKYIDFFRDVNRGDYRDKTISRDTVLVQLVTLLLEDRLVSPPLNHPIDFKVTVVEAALKHFEVVSVNNVHLDFIQNCWNGDLPESTDTYFEERAREYNLLKKEEVYTRDVQLTIWSMFGIKPLFVQVNPQFLSVIQHLVCLCRHSLLLKITFVLLGADELGEFERCKVFRNMTDLIESGSEYRALMSSFEVSLQGRESVTLETLSTNFQLQIDHLIIPDQLFQMLKGRLLIGTKLQELPAHYIERILLPTEFHYTYLADIVLEETIVVNCGDRLEEFREKLRRENIQWPVVEIKFHQWETGPVIVLTDHETCTTDLCVEQFVLTNRNYLQNVVNTIKPGSPKLFNKQLNAVCAQTGSGKTTLMKLLANKCPSDYWIVTIHLQEFRTFFKSRPSASDIILKQVASERSELVDGVIKQMTENKKIVFMFDGLDELNRENIEHVTETMLQLTTEGYKIWLFATTNVLEVVEKLKIYSTYDIKDLDENEMRKYIKNQLANQNVSEESINRIIQRVFEEAFPIQGGIDILRTPLILNILTEVLRNNNNWHNLQDSFVLTKMYACFVEGKLKHSVAKIRKRNYEEIEEDEMEDEKWGRSMLFNQYQIGALKICLEPEVFKPLNLENDPAFLQDLRTKNDFMGIVTKVNSDNTLVFSHHSFAVYFTAIWLADNFHKIPKEKQTFIFDRKYELLQYFLNLKLAEDCPLHLAVLRNDVSQVRDLLPYHCNTLDKGGRTPLHLCVSIEFRCSFPQTLCGYCRRHEQVLKLVNRAEHVRMKDTLLDLSPIEYADHSLSMFSMEQMAKLTSLQPTDVSMFIHQVKSKNPVLYTATRSNFVNVAKILIEAGVQLEDADGNRRTALHEAALYNWSSTAILLLDKGANFEAKDVFGLTPLHLSARKGYLETAKVLVQNGAKVDAKDENGRSPLHHAAYWGQTVVVQYLIREGANVNLKDSNDEAVLHCAAEMGHSDVVRYLLDLGASVNAADRYGRTALYRAACEGHLEVMEGLIGRGGDCTKTDRDGRSVKDVAAEKRHIDVVDYLESLERQFPETHSSTSGQMTFHTATQVFNKMKDQTALHRACQRGHLALVQQLLNNNEDFEALDDEGWTPLHRASLQGYLDIIKALVMAGANVCNCTPSGNTTIHIASEGGYNDVIDCMLSQGVRLDARNRRWQTCLHLAAKQGHEETVRHLLALNPDLVNICDYEGRTALHWAAEKGHRNVGKMLLDGGADEQIIDYYGQKAFQTAENARRQWVD